MVYKMLYTHRTELDRADPSGSALTVPKFMISMREKAFAVISSEAKDRGVTVQELLRAVIVPEWAKENLQPSTNADYDANYARPDQILDVRQTARLEARNHRGPAKDLVRRSSAGNMRFAWNSVRANAACSEGGE